MPSITIISGSLKGRKIKITNREDLRPMSGKVRGALFNMLGPNIMGASFLDLFSGSGALAIEAYSRGAGDICIVEREIQDLEAILVELGISDKIELLPGEAQEKVTELSLSGRKFDIITVDPPYQLDGFAFMKEYRLWELLSPQGSVIYSHSSRDETIDVLAGLRLKKEKVFGDTKLTIFKCVASSI